MVSKGFDHKEKSKWWWLTGIAVFFLSLGILPLSSKDLAFSQGAEVGMAKNAIGSLLVVRVDGIQETLQGEGSLPLFNGDVLKTDPTNLASIEFKNGIQMTLNEDTEITLLQRWEKDKPLVNIVRLKYGEILVNTGPGSKPFEVETPVANARVRQTEFSVKEFSLKVQKDGHSILQVAKGIVEFGTAFGTCPIRASTISYGQRGKKCTKPVPTDVKLAIAWAGPLRP